MGAYRDAEVVGEVGGEVGGVVVVGRLREAVVVGLVFKRGRKVMRMVEVERVGGGENLVVGEVQKVVYGEAAVCCTR